jgi:hypothetical protein
MLEPKTSITGSVYLRTAPDEMFERVSSIVCEKDKPEIRIKIKNVIDICLIIFLILKKIVVTIKNSLIKKLLMSKKEQILFLWNN